MALTVDAIREHFPAVDEELARQHLERLPARYFESHTPAEVAAHVERLQALSADHPVQLIIEAGGADTAECTVCAYDYPGAFSLITSLLASSGFNIRSGNVFTYKAAGYSREARRGGGRDRAREQRDAGLRRRRIVDAFSGTVAVPLEAFRAAIERSMGEAFALLERGGDGPARARQLANERVAESLSRLELDSSAALYPVHMDVDESDERWTRLTVVSEDTPFFLSSFSTALALRGISIEHVAIRTYDRRIEDTFDLVDAARGTRLEPATLDQVRLSVLLTKQFTYFLTRAPDPYVALTRFESLIDGILALPQQGRWIDLLSNPRVMEDLARLLGTSDFLWEDFIRTQYESLIPMLGPAVEGRSFAAPPEELAGRLREALAAAAGPDDEVREAQRLQGPRGLPHRPRQHPEPGGRVPAPERAADAPGRGGGPGGLCPGVEARPALLRAADDRGGPGSALRHPRGRQARAARPSATPRTSS